MTSSGSLSSRLCLFTLLVTTPLLAQQKAAPLDDPPISQKDLRPWVLETQARVARAFQYQLGLQEQPGTVTIQNAGGVQFLPNPEHYLIKHSLTFSLGELFLTHSDFGSALKNFYLYDPVQASRVPNLSALCGRKRWAMECIATSGAWWQRMLSGVKATFSLSERTRVVSEIIVPEGPFPKDYDKAGEIDFDPSQLFVTGSDWKTAAASVADINPLLQGSKDPVCFPDPKSGSLPDPPDAAPAEVDRLAKCVLRYSGSKRGKVGFLAAAVPTFRFVRQTQFDFLKNGGVLVPAPFPESALNSYTFTWDFKRLIAPAKERIAVSDAMKSYNADALKANNSGKAGTKLCVMISNNQKSFMPISGSFPEKACASFADWMKADTFEFACVGTNGVPAVGAEKGLGPKPTEGNCRWGTD